MNRSVLLVFLFALLQLVAGGKGGYGFGGVAIAETYTGSAVKGGKYGKKYASSAVAGGTGIAVGGPYADAFSASGTKAKKGFASGFSVAGASVGGKKKKGCKEYEKCD
eukprot:TRINITY_DN81_c0_g1_i6.p4 TRINITY_DN81_c0_g1~~TRINITY_DN81_c0_g1_i6.p4  ORF type:complete len:108 (+),score=27.45 TRINITY_DN81_c0_g1_i6:146-469(+)